MLSEKQRKQKQQLKNKKIGICRKLRMPFPNYSMKGYIEYEV